MKEALLIIVLAYGLCASESVFAAKVSTACTPPLEGTNDFYVLNRPPLIENPLAKLPIGSIKPKGWLRGQLELMAKGMVGRLDEDNLSPFITESSGWWDGKSAGWEELPYWVKGLGDLGYVLGDEKIIAKARKWLDKAIQSQREDGYFGPPANWENKDLWPNMIMLYAFQSLYEATGDERIIPLMTKYFRWELSVPEEDFLPGSWQKVRGGDNLESVYWLYNRTGEPWLLELAEKVHRRTSDWTSGIASYHGVNFAQCLKEPAVYYQQSRDKKHLDAAERNYQQLMNEYGQFPGGMMAADENCREGKTGAEQAAETCAMVEYMFSNESLLRITGDPKYADRCEEIAFNSLPASMTPDYKGLHYLTAANHVMCDRGEEHCYQNSGMMVAYSPGVVYRCCQHNVAQGWPYYAEHLWMATRGNGLAAVLYAECEVKAKVGDGTEVTILEETNYPFDEVVIFTVRTPKPVTFPLMLRIPGWCDAASASVNGKMLSERPKPLSYLIIEREWKDGDVVRLSLPMTIRVKQWQKQNGGISVQRGPLSYSLKIGEQWIDFGRTDEWPDKELMPSTPWNYGLVLQPGDPSESFVVHQKPGVPSQPFTPEAVPIWMTAKGKKIPEWTLVQNCAGPVPAGPITNNEPEEEITLIPMGAARLRITVFPIVK